MKTMSKVNEYKTKLIENGIVTIEGNSCKEKATIFMKVLDSIKVNASKVRATLHDFTIIVLLQYYMLSSIYKLNKVII